MATAKKAAPKKVASKKAAAKKTTPKKAVAKKVAPKKVAPPTGATAKLPAEFFGIEPNVSVMHQVVTAQLAHRRSGTQSTKTRAEVRGARQRLSQQEVYGLTMIFISHNLAVVKAVSNRIMVMYLGKVCEVGTPDAIYANPAHHYTSALIDSVPVPDPTRDVPRALLQGEPPSPVDPPSGCRFRTRCPAASEICANVEPLLREIHPDQFVACHHPRS